MKFKFKLQDYQTDAVNTIVKVFEGQPYKDKVSYLRDIGNIEKNIQMSFIEDDINYIDDNSSGFENAKIELSDEQLLANINKLQSSNNIKQSSSLSMPFGRNCRCSLDIEMETGTGKTYVYIKTMFEMNKQYGWSKFIIIVPSIAIREGVRKSFEMTADHFFEYYGKKIRYFIYNSKNLNQLDNFSSSKDINVMIINSQAFAVSLKEGAKNEAARIIYSKQDSFGSRKPIDIIAANRPIIILDEPQKLSGNATQESIKKFNPLFTINFSATHRDRHNLIYVLDALDAYNKKLVKKIEVKGFERKNLTGTDGFIFLSQILIDSKKPPMARVVFEVNHSKGIKRESRILKTNDDLYEMSAGSKMPPLEEYKNGYVISEINPINNTITLLNGAVINVGEVNGDISERDLRRIQIRETILSHFEKEELLYNKGIKCLSLFFIDEVSHYRQYEDGVEKLGDYGVIFEEEYINVLNEYINLIETPYIKYLKGIDVHKTHNGYFSIDKKTNKIINSEEKKGHCDDISAYELILKNKERLLSFEEPTRFIFSHSALREGWDNPNIFQICTLKQSNSEINKRQEVGRGMRLCVDFNGDRIDSSNSSINVHDINVLTVIANEGYAEFVRSLQSDLAADLYSRPLIANKEYFIGKTVHSDDNKTVEITNKMADEIIYYLIENKYIDIERNITQEYRNAQKTDEYAELPKDLIMIGNDIHKLIQGIYDENIFNEMVSKANKPKILNNNLNENFYKKEFQTLWKYINHKYAYTVNFNSNELIEKAIDALNELYVSVPTFIKSTGSQGNQTLEFTISKTKLIKLNNKSESNIKYDLIGKISHETKLTRKTIVAIMKGIRSDIFHLFKINPEEFIAKSIKIINEQRATIIVDEIKYNITNEQPYSSDIFTADKASNDLKNLVETHKHITPWITVDSDTEKHFAIDLENAKDDICVYAKLPRTFRIPTPVGDYAPDWAIAFYEGKVKYIYFIAETKGSLSSLQLKRIEDAKIKCAKKLFSKLSGGIVHYDVADTYQHLMEIMNK